MNHASYLMQLPDQRLVWNVDRWEASDVMTDGLICGFRSLKLRCRIKCSMKIGWR